MYGKLLRQDIQKNFWRNLVLFLFMTLSAGIAIGVCLMLTQLFTSISTMYENARPPHFLQMHKGTLNQEEIDWFNETYPGIEYWQTVPMIDVQGEELTVVSQTGEIFDLSQCRLDISLVHQNEAYDVLLITFLILTPARMVGTMENPEFVTYMGSPLCDVLLEAEQGEELEKRRAAAEELLYREQEQGSVECFELLRRVRLQAIDGQGELTGVHVDTGSSAGGGLKYLEGHKPKDDSEIALSGLLADELGKQTGDSLQLLVSGEEKECRVSGIYQDVTSGGRTAKMVCEFPQETAERYTFQIYGAESVNPELCMETWREQLGAGYSIENMETFLAQTLGGVTAQLARASQVVWLLGLGLSGLMTLLFLKLRLTREMGALAVKRVLGLSWQEIFRQELSPILLAGSFGILLGVVLTEFLGEKIVSVLLGLLGIGLQRIEFSSFQFLPVLGLAVALAVVLAAVSWTVFRQSRKMRAAEYLNE